MLQLSYSPLYEGAISPDARFPRSRYGLVREAVEPLNDGVRARIIPAREATVEELKLAHDPGYIRSFLNDELDEAARRRIGFRPWTSAFIPRTLEVIGGSLQAVEAVLDGARCAGNLAGGTHHAFAGHGEGYCVFNDLAIGAHMALARGIERLLVLDLDVHQGNGTAALLRDEPRALTCSLHGARNYPTRKEISDVDVALPDGARDDAYLSALERELRALVWHHSPELIFYQAGVDGLAEDTLGRLALTHEGLRERDRLVFDHARWWGCPVVVFMGGGYADPITASVAAHAHVFEEAARFAADA